MAVAGVAGDKRISAEYGMTCLRVLIVAFFFHCFNSLSEAGVEEENCTHY